MSWHSGGGLTHYSGGSVPSSSAGTLTGSPPTPVVTAAAPVSVGQVAPSPPPSQLALSNEIGIATNSGVVRDESLRASIIDLMKAAFGAVLALAWAMVGAWLGMR